MQLRAAATLKTTITDGISYPLGPVENDPLHATSPLRRARSVGSEEPACVAKNRNDVEWSFDPRWEDAAERVRTEIRRALEAHHRADAILRLDMIYAELVSNAIRHAPGTIEIAVECQNSGGDVTLHVLDRGPGYRLDPHLPSDIFSECGRGLFIISTFADGFIVEERRDGGSHARIVLKPGAEMA